MCRVSVSSSAWMNRQARQVCAWPSRRSAVRALRGGHLPAVATSITDTFRRFGCLRPVLQAAGPSYRLAVE